MINAMLSLYNELPYVIVPCSDDEQFTYNMERSIIESFGLYDNGGILTNVTFGGLGGHKGKVICKDAAGVVVIVDKDDLRIGFELTTVSRKNHILTKDKDDNIISILKDDLRLKSGELTNFHLGASRSEETKQNISRGKLQYKFTEEHLKNITEANRKISREVHQNAKRSNSTKEAISRSRFGSKSKIAKIYKVITPNNDIIVYKGGVSLVCEMYKLSYARVKKHINLGAIPYPHYKGGHLNSEVYNCTGWQFSEERDESNINFEFIFL